MPRINKLYLSPTDPCCLWPFNVIRGDMTKAGTRVAPSYKDPLEPRSGTLLPPIGGPTNSAPFWNGVTKEFCFIPDTLLNSYRHCIHDDKSYAPFWHFNKKVLDKCFKSRSQDKSKLKIVDKGSFWYGLNFTLNSKLVKIAISSYLYHASRHTTQ